MVFEALVTTFLGVHIPHCFPFCWVDPYTGAAAPYGPCAPCCLPAAQAGAAPALCCIACLCPGVAVGAAAQDQLANHILEEDAIVKQPAQLELEREGRQLSANFESNLVALNLVSVEDRNKSTHSLLDDLEGEEEESEESFGKSRKASAPSSPTTFDI